MEFSSLVDPNNLTVELALLLLIIFALYGYLAIRLRSMIGLFSLGVMIIVFITTFIAGVSFIWFWVMSIITMIVLIIGGVIYFADM